MTTYDFIIVGVGSAGCVLANRRNKSAAYKVRLIGAGSPDKSMLILFYHSEANHEFIYPIR